MIMKKVLLCAVFALSLGCASWAWAGDENGAGEKDGSIVFGNRAGGADVEGMKDAIKNLEKKTEEVQGQLGQFYGHACGPYPVARGTGQENFDYNKDGKLESFEYEAYIKNGTFCRYESMSSFKKGTAKDGGIVEELEDLGEELEDAMEGMQDALKKIKK